MEQLLTLTSIAVAIFSGVVVATIPSVRISGGDDAEPGQFPYQVSIQASRHNGQPFEHICGGSILSQSWILTAAHCFNDTAYHQIVAGITDLNGTNPEREVRNCTRVIFHPEFSWYTLQNDLALIELQEPLTFSKFIEAIQLPKAESNAKGEAIATGWGRINMAANKFPNTLQTIKLCILPDIVCSIVDYYPKEGAKICTISLFNGMCSGDDGGPLVQNGQLIGILSNFIGCDSLYPDIFTKVSAYIDFIEKHVNAEH